MNMPLFQLVCFYLFAAVTVAGAVAVISVRNTIHAALSLVLTFFSSACLWMLLQAEFLALALIVVYVGAVMVLFLFVVMMLDIDQERVREGFIRHLPVGIVVAAVMLVEMLGMIGVRVMHQEALGVDPAQAAGGNIRWLGEVLFTQYLLPFEVAALILTVGVVAAVALTLRTREGVKHENPVRQVAAVPGQRVRLVKMAAEVPAPVVVPPAEEESAP
ncbi:NADH-quinone oxidoreductase subunit J [Frateuria aurantia]